TWQKDLPVKMLAFSRQAGMLLAGWVALATLGCKSVWPDKARSSVGRPDEKSETASADAPLAQPDSLRPASMSDKGKPEGVALDVSVKNALASGSWVVAVSPDGGEQPSARWRHPLIEALPPADHLEQFRLAQTSSEPVIAANAVICLARYAGEADAQQLAQIARKRQHPLPVRLAAVECLGKLSESQGAELLAKLLDDLASRELFATPQYVPEFHAELLYALSDAAGALPDPAEAEDSKARFIAGLDSPSAIVRLAAVRGFTKNGTALPPELLDRRTDSDARVRAVVLEAISRSAFPEARQHLLAALAPYE